MKRLAHISGLKAWSLVLLLAAASTSCDNVLDEEYEDCATYVRFKYDMNMKYADAFSTSVKSVALYVFDKEGKLFLQKTESGEPLSREGYRMRLDEIPRNEKDNYEYITWAGLTSDQSFSVPSMTPGVSTKEELECKLTRLHEDAGGRAAGDAYVDYDLEDLYHGRTVAGASHAAGSDEVLVSLTKNTNKIRVILQQMASTPIDVNDFEFRIADENGWLDYDNSLLEDETVTYYPYYRTSGSTAFDEGQVVGDTDNVNVAVVQLTTSRLVESQNPFLTITNTKTGEQVLRIPLIKYLLLTEAEGHQMTAQEYLDRQDEYALTFFLDENSQWISSSIIINSWKVVLQNSDFN